MKIYTKTGDHGQTYLSNGLKVDKDDLRIEVVGELDELNSHLGCLASSLYSTCDVEHIERLQRIIFSISSNLLNGSFSLKEDICLIENEIDKIQDVLPPQETFILPGGCSVAAHTHVCRVVCRMVERHAFALSKSHPVNADVLKFLNRLSDYFFVLARKLNFENGIDEKTWQNTCR